MNRLFVYAALILRGLSVGTVLDVKYLPAFEGAAGEQQQIFATHPPPARIACIGVAIIPLDYLYHLYHLNHLDNLDNLYHLDPIFVSMIRCAESV